MYHRFFLDLVKTERSCYELNSYELSSFKCSSSYVHYSYGHSSYESSSFMSVAAERAATAQIKASYKEQVSKNEAIVNGSLRDYSDVSDTRVMRQ